MNQKLFFISIFPLLLTILTESKPIKKPKEILNIGLHTVIPEKRNRLIIDSFKIVSMYLEYISKAELMPNIFSFLIRKLSKDLNCAKYIFWNTFSEML